MPKRQADAHCGGTGTIANEGPISLPVLAARPAGVRKSRTSKWRTMVLIAVHLAMIAHIAHWWFSGRSVSPLEPSESMYTLNYGHLNAGFLFFCAAILATVLLGRFVCGWGCHFVAYQDFCWWLLKKIGIRPKPLRSRILVLAPLALALYMFVWPTVYRWCVGAPAPALSNHLTKSNFWETFPGPVITVLTVLVAGMAIVYFLGAKGFCTYACPYGGFFGLADKVAPGRILVTDDCEHCGHCTSVCTSNVRVHEEVALYGMVVDPGCMKCMDCISVCPNDALYFGFTNPFTATKARRHGATKGNAETPKRQNVKTGNAETSERRNVKTGQSATRNPQSAVSRRPVPYDFTLLEEVLMVLVGLVALLAYRGLYEHIPLLMAMGMAAMTAYVAMKAVHLLRNTNVRLQNLQLKRGGTWTRTGIAFAAGAFVLGVFVAQSGAVQYKGWRGRSHFATAGVDDEIWAAQTDWWEHASVEQRSRVDAAISDYRWADRWGLMSNYTVVKDLVWLHLARGEIDQAELGVRRLMRIRPKAPDPYRGLAGILRKQGRIDEAVAFYRKALEIDPEFLPARGELLNTLLDVGRTEEALVKIKEFLHEQPHEVRWALDFADRLLKRNLISEAQTVLDELLRKAPKSARAHWLLGVALFQMDDVAGGLQHLRAAVEYDPNLAEAHYDLGLALLRMDQLAPAIPHLQNAVRLKSDFALAHYNLGVALAMAGRPEEAVAYVREAVRLLPHDLQAQRLLQTLLEQTRAPSRGP